MILQFLLLASLVAIFVIAFHRKCLPDRMPLLAENPAAGTSEPAKAVILHSKSGPYTLELEWQRPRISPKEVLIKGRAIGLNPIDWKCVAFGFGVHSVPWISGREASGTVEEIGSDVHGFRLGERVFVTSTNYRDNRTSTFQEVSEKPLDPA